MNHRAGRAEHGDQLGEIVRIARQNVVPQPEGQLHEMPIYDVRRMRESQEPTDRRTVIKRVHRDRLEKRSQAGLAGPIPPYLGHNRMRRMQPRGRASDSREKDACGLIAAVDRDQYAGVKDHSP